MLHSRHVAPITDISSRMKRNKNKLIDPFDKALAEKVVFFSVVIFQGVAPDSEVKWPLRED